MAKKEQKQKVKCIDCKNAFLMQWDNNPIIATCKHESRSVACTPHVCTHYVQTKEDKEIKHYSHYT